MLCLYIKLLFLIPLLIFLLLLFFLFILSIKYKIDRKFKKNCFKCKYYELHSVALFGGLCRYKCTLKNIYCMHNFNDRVKLTKCKDFESE